MPTRQVTVATTGATQVVAYNPKRTALSLKNDGSTKIYIAHAQQSIDTIGYPLSAGDAVDFIRALGDEPELDLWAIALVGAGTLAVQESFERVEVPVKAT